MFYKIGPRSLDVDVAFLVWVRALSWQDTRYMEKTTFFGSVVLNVKHNHVFCRVAKVGWNSLTKIEG